MTPTRSGAVFGWGRSMMRALACWSASCTSARTSRTVRAPPGAPTGGRMVSVTVVPLGPRISWTIRVSGMALTSTVAPVACATATIRSPGFSSPLSAAGPPGTSSWIVQTPSSFASVAPMPNSERFMAMDSESIDSLPM